MTPVVQLSTLDEFIGELQSAPDSILDRTVRFKVSRTPEQKEAVSWGVVVWATAIMQLSNGYHTKLGFAGESLSGGQKQRIAIARAFLRNAPILLLDEATSALDPRTETEIQDSLERLSVGRTTIVIAHRLSTVINADHMVLMHEGSVAATGTHTSLLAESSLYRNHFGI